jgi:hypothetical protein
MEGGGGIAGVKSDEAIGEKRALFVKIVKKKKNYRLFAFSLQKWEKSLKLSEKQIK